MGKDLLTYIYEQSDYTYLSDLKFVKSKTVANIIKNIDVNKFKLEEWNELYIYLIGNDSDLQDSQEIKNALIKKLYR